MLIQDRFGRANLPETTGIGVALPPRQGGGHWFEPSIAHRIWPRVYGVFCVRGLTGQVGLEAVFPHASHMRAPGSDSVRMDDVAPEHAPELAWGRWRERIIESAYPVIR